MSAFQKAMTTVLPRTEASETGEPIHAAGTSSGAGLPTSLSQRSCSVAESGVATQAASSASAAKDGERRVVMREHTMGMGAALGSCPRPDSEAQFMSTQHVIPAIGSSILPVRD